MELPGWVWVTHRVDVPSSLTAWVGRIMVEWSEFEWQLEEAIRLLLDSEIKPARIIVAGMNARSRLRAISNLVQSHTLAPAIHKEAIDIGNRIEKVQPGRDIVAHGLWGRVNGQWYVLTNSGSRTLPPWGKVARVVLPQRLAVTPDSLRAIRDSIRHERNRLARLRTAIQAALPPSSRKSPAQHRQDAPTRAHSKSKR